jgi:hypothetical protein
VEGKGDRDLLELNYDIGLKQENEGALLALPAERKQNTF